MNILIVDDEQKIRRIFSNVMRKEGFSVMEAASVSEAYDLMLNFPADLVLLDINLPEVNGTDFHDIARVFCKQSKFIVTSVYPLADQQRLVPGADDYYDKSDSLSELIGKVRRLASLKEVPE